MDILLIAVFLALGFLGYRLMGSLDRYLAAHVTREEAPDEQDRFTAG